MLPARSAYLCLPPLVNQTLNHSVIEPELGQWKDLYFIWYVYIKMKIEKMKKKEKII